MPPSLRRGLTQIEQFCGKWPGGRDREVPVDTVGRHSEDGQTGKKLKFDRPQNIELTREGDDEADTEPGEICAIAPAANRAACLWVVVETPPGSGQGASTRAMVDSGNLTRQGIVI